MNLPLKNHKMFKLSKAKSGMLPPQWLWCFLFFYERFKASATPAYPKPLGASIPLLALDNLNIFSRKKSKELNFEWFYQKKCSW